MTPMDYLLPDESPEAVVDFDANAQRAFEVEQAIDPDGTLPDVDIIPDPEVLHPKGTLTPISSLIMHNGECIGRATLVANHKLKETYFNGINIDSEHRGNGFGMSAYKEAIESAMIDGYTFRTHDWTQTEAAKKVWEKLADAGVATVVDEFKPIPSGGFIGHYEVRPAEPR